MGVCISCFDHVIFFCLVFLVFYSLAQIRTSLRFTITSIIQSAIISSVTVLDFGLLCNVLIC